VHWFVVASQKEVRIFVKSVDGKKIKLVETLTNPLGLEKRKAFIRKQPGQGVRSVGNTGSIHYSEPKRSDPHEQATIQFAKAVCDYLKGEKLKKSFASLTVVAEPHLLGILRSEMDDAVENAVTNWIKKDLQNTPQIQLKKFLVPTSYPIELSEF